MLNVLLKTQFWTRFSLESGCVFIIYRLWFIFEIYGYGYRIYITSS